MQPRDGEWPVPIETTRGAQAATLAWRFRGQHYLTVVLKATFALVPGGRMKPVDPEPITREEEDDDIGLRTAGELAPYLWMADVLVTGHARPRAEAVYFGLGRDEGELLIDKAVPVSSGDEGRGGLGAPIVGLGPLSRSWPVRSRLLGGVDPKLLEGLEMTIPEELDASYFQAAPLDQRLERLCGDEWLMFELGPEEDARIATRLPGVRGVAWLYGRTPALSSGEALPLMADTLHVDLDRWVCNLLWRGWAPVPKGEELSTLRALGRVELFANAPPSTRNPALEARRNAAEAPTSLEGTVRLDAETKARLLNQPVLPFGQGPFEAVAKPSRAAPRLGRTPQEYFSISRSPTDDAGRAAGFATASFPPAPSESSGIAPATAAPRTGPPAETTRKLDLATLLHAVSKPATPFEQRAPVSVRPEPIEEPPQPPPETPEMANIDPEMSLGAHFLVAMGLPLKEPRA